MILEYLLREPEMETMSVTVPITTSVKPPLLVLLHGTGSNERDLFMLASKLPKNFLIVSVRAPYTVRPGSFRWYEVDFSSGIPHISVDEEVASRGKIKDFLEELREVHPYDESQVFLCGFSQGAIMSYSVGLLYPQYIRGIIALSGRMLGEVWSEVQGDALSPKLEALIIHGTQDAVLPIHCSREAQSQLETLGIVPAYYEFEYGHTITEQTLATVSAWLNEKVSH